MNSLLNQLQTYEQTLSYRTPPDDGALPFAVRQGTRPVLLSAPHAATHMRGDDEKIEEEYTASVARYVAAQTSGHAIYATHKLDEDPNWDEGSRYKQALAQIVREHGIALVIDVHGMTNRHNIGIALGTMKGQSIEVNSAELTTPFKQNGFNLLPLDQLNTLQDPDWRRLVIDHPKFTGGLKNHTITRFASQTLGVAALQVEITSTARIVYRGPNRGWPYEYWGDPDGIRSAVAALIALVEALVP